MHQYIAVMAQSDTKEEERNRNLPHLSHSWEIMLVGFLWSTSVERYMMSWNIC